MLLKKLIFFFLILAFNFSFGQKKKKKIDTVYVYENIVVYDTVYLEKPFKAKLQDFSMKNPQIQQKEIKAIV